MEDDCNPVGECPACGEEVLYDEWGVAYGVDLLCPYCGEAFHVDDVYPQA